MSEKAKGKAKEAYGAVAGDEGKKAEGQAQQRKEAARDEREQQELKDKGPLGGLTDGLTGR